MATSSITHNFVISNAVSAEKFIEALDKPPIIKSELCVEHIREIDKARLLVKRWKKDLK